MDDIKDYIWIMLGVGSLLAVQLFYNHHTLLVSLIIVILHITFTISIALIWLWYKMNEKANKKIKHAIGVATYMIIVPAFLYIYEVNIYVIMMAMFLPMMFYLTWPILQYISGDSKQSEPVL